MSRKTHSQKFPGESSRYRVARNRLLAAEIDLRRQVERVARMRRKLPLGGPVPEDYIFDDGSGRQVKLSELFRNRIGYAAHLQLHVRTAGQTAVPDVHFVY